MAFRWVYGVDEEGREGYFYHSPYAPFSYMIEKEGEKYLVIDSRKRVREEYDDVHEAIQNVVERIPDTGGKIFLKGDLTISDKVTIPPKPLLIAGDFSTITLNTPIFLEFDAHGDWSKYLVLKDLRFKPAEGITLPVIVHYIDAVALTMENVITERCKVLVESVDYWCEGVNLERVTLGQLEYRLTGGTGSWGYANLLWVSFDPPENEAGLLINGGHFYGSYLNCFFHIRDFIRYGIRTINGGDFRNNYGFIRCDVVYSGSKLLDFQSGSNIYNNILIKSDLTKDAVNVGNWGDGVRIGGFKLLQKGYFRNNYSVEVGTGGVYGSAKTIAGLFNIPDEIVISVSGVATGETITVKIETEWAPDQVRSFEKSYTADTTEHVSRTDIGWLFPLGNLVSPLETRAYAKSDQASTTASVTITVYNWA